MKLFQSIKKKVNAEPTTNQHQSQTVNITNTPIAPQISQELEQPVELPALKDVPLTERIELSVKKLRSVEILCDFTSNAQLSEKEKKKQTLTELIEFISTASGPLKIFSNESFLVGLFRAAAANLFRPLPSRATAGTTVTTAIEGGEEDEPVLDPAWVHLQLVHELLLRTIVSPDLDAKTSKTYLSQNFIGALVSLFKSEDPREREYLKTLLHRIYGKYMVHRSFVRRLMQDFFLAVAYEKDVGVGVAELLEILGSIINGFALPLKDEHKLYLAKVLMPLHKSRQLGLFHQQLLYCVTQYIEKDAKLAAVVVGGVLRLWPKENSNKELLFIQELEEVLELTTPGELRLFAKIVVKKLATLLTSSNFQIAERALFVWNNEAVNEVLASIKDIVYPVLVPVLLENAKRHWNGSVHAFTCNLLKLLNEQDPGLYASASVGPVIDLSGDVDVGTLDEWKGIKEQAENLTNNVTVITASPEFDL
jgi:serine/threonine-protein phosphatase 2A regulatory subunit B'